MLTGILNRLPHSEMYCGIRNYLPRPIIYLYSSTYPHQTQAQLCEPHHSETVVH